ncbi:MAG: hypothetical protein PHQ74_06975 [Crocinitomicaceae bacterium]|nr:hypothetical protein [Crocinitomicaceae bacterium]
MEHSSISRDSDKRNGIITSVAVTVVIIVLMKFFHYTIADPPPKDIPLVASTEMTELELEKLVVESGGSSGSQGTPSDAPVEPKPKPQTEQVITKTDSKTEVQTGKSTKTTGNNTDNTPTTIKAAPNPFGSGGGSTQGEGAGIFGKDDGAYRGGSSGTGGGGEGESSGERIRLNNINTEGLEFNQTCTIVLKLTINSEGKVIRTEVISGRTTTTDQRIINQIAELVKQQIRYNKKPGAAIEKIALSLNIKAT